MKLKQFIYKTPFFYWIYKLQKLYKNKKPNFHFSEFGEDIIINRFFKNCPFTLGNWIVLKEKSTIMLKSCFLFKTLAFLIQCGFGRGKQPVNCGKSSTKYFNDFILRILIYTESIKSKSRKRQVIHWFSTDFLKI